MISILQHTSPITIGTYVALRDPSNRSIWQVTKIYEGQLYLKYVGNQSPDGTIFPPLDVGWHPESKFKKYNDTVYTQPNHESI